MKKLITSKRRERGEEKNTQRRNQRLLFFPPFSHGPPRRTRHRSLMPAEAPKFDDAAARWFIGGVLAVTALVLSFVVFRRFRAHRRHAALLARRLPCTCRGCAGEKAAAMHRAGVASDLAGPSLFVTLLMLALCGAAWAATVSASRTAAQ
jgi:hypothetical protein